MQRVIEFNMNFPKCRPPDNDASKYESLCFNETNLGISKIDAILFYFLNKGLNNSMILLWSHQYFGKKLQEIKFKQNVVSLFTRKGFKKWKKIFLLKQDKIFKIINYTFQYSTPSFQKTCK